MLFAVTMFIYEPRGLLNKHMSDDLRSSFIERHTFEESGEVMLRALPPSIMSHAIFRCDGDFDVRLNLYADDDTNTLKSIAKIDGKAIPGTNMTRVAINCALSPFHVNKMSVVCSDGKPVEMLFVNTVLSKDMCELRPRVAVFTGSAPPHPRFSFAEFPAGKYTFGKDTSHHVCEEIEVDRRLKSVTIAVNNAVVTFDKVALDLLREDDGNISVLPALLFPAKIDVLVITLDDGTVTDDTPVRELKQQKAVVYYE